MLVVTQDLDAVCVHSEEVDHGNLESNLGIGGSNRTEKEQNGLEGKQQNFSNRLYMPLCLPVLNWKGE